MKYLQMILALMMFLSVIGCSGDAEMSEEDSVESIMKDAQKNAGSQTAPENEWKPRSAPPSAEKKDAPGSGK